MTTPTKSPAKKVAATPPKTAVRRSTPTKAAPAKATPTKAAPTRPAKPTTGSLFEPEQVHQVLLKNLHPHPDNIRKDTGDLNGMIASIKAAGILEPLLVEPHPTRTGHYLILAGWRRHTAAALIPIKTAPCIVREDITVADRAELMLVENLQREGLTPLEEANGFQRLIDAEWTQAKIAERIGCHQSHVSKRLSLLQLPEKASAALTTGKLTVEDALALTKIADQPELVDRIVTTTTKNQRTGAYSASIPRQIEMAEREARLATKAHALRAKLDKQGVRYLDHAPPKAERVGQYYLELDAKAHAAEPCHVVVLTTHYDEVSANDYCTEPGRHNARGESTLKRPSNREKSERQLTPAQRDEREATDERKLFIRRVLDPEITPDDPRILLGSREAFDELVESRYLADMASDECGKVAKLLHLPPIAHEGQNGTDWHETVDVFVRRSPANRRRACLAFALVQGEDYIPGRGETKPVALKLLVDLGYTPHKSEIKHLPTGTTITPTPEPVAEEQLDIDPAPTEDEAVTDLLETENGDIVNTATGEVLEHAPDTAEQPLFDALVVAPAEIVPDTDNAGDPIPLDRVLTDDERHHALEHRERAAATVLEAGYAAQQLLQRELGVDPTQAWAILIVLEEDGTLGPKGDYGLRPVLATCAPSEVF